MDGEPERARVRHPAGGPGRARQLAGRPDRWPGSSPARMRRWWPASRPGPAVMALIEAGEDLTFAGVGEVGAPLAALAKEGAVLGGDDLARVSEPGRCGRAGPRPARPAAAGGGAGGVAAGLPDLGDVLARLRRVVAPSGELIDEASDELARLRRELRTHGRRLERAARPSASIIPSSASASPRSATSATWCRCGPTSTRLATAWSRAGHRAGASFFVEPFTPGAAQQPGARAARCGPPGGAAGPARDLGAARLGPCRSRRRPRRGGRARRHPGPGPARPAARRRGARGERRRRAPAERCPPTRSSILGKGRERSCRSTSSWAPRSGRWSCRDRTPAARRCPQDRRPARGHAPGRTAGPGRAGRAAGVTARCGPTSATPRTWSRT